jgi:predicted DsbA family dithiol-disulfide isomerase
MHDVVHQRLMSAYWAENRDISDPAVLADVTGLDLAEVIDVVATRPYEDRIRASTVAVHEMGANGVPAFVVDDKLLIPGAQPHSLFEKVMEKLGFESVAGTDDAPGPQS